MEPKIACWDIEISPTYGTFWGSKYETNILEITQPWIIISFSLKWLGGEHITKALPDYPGYAAGSMDDTKLVRHLHALLSKADILVHQNGDQFDVKKANARFIIHGLPPLAPLKTVDTLKVARQKFGFTSNKLDDLGETLGLGRKLEHPGYKMWEGCMRGEKTYWDLMKRYNRQDVILLERVYKKLLPWISSHPTMGMWSEKNCCPKCGSRSLQFRGWAMNRATKYHRMQCIKCGGWCRSIHNQQENKPLVSM